MRKIMKRKSNRKEKIIESKDSDEENGVEESINTKHASDEEESERSPSESKGSSEPEQKKKKSGKRKSRSANKKSKKNSKKDGGVEKNEEDEGEDAENEEQYEVEEILGEKLVRGVKHYLIRWKGYEPESDSWEPVSTLNCPELIKKFKLSKGRENSKKSNKRKNEPTKKSKGKKLKESNKNEPEVDWESGDEFEVDRILDVYFKRNGTREFLVSWKGYAQSQASWEPEENLDCIDLITKFMSKLDQAKSVEQKELRINRTPTERFTLNMYSGCGGLHGRRLSRRLNIKQRIRYYDAE